MIAWKVRNKFLRGRVPSVDETTKKMNTPTGHLAETTNAEPDAMAQVDRQKKNIALNVKKNTLPTDVG